MLIKLKALMQRQIRSYLTNHKREPVQEYQFRISITSTTYKHINSPLNQNRQTLENSFINKLQNECRHYRSTVVMLKLRAS